ncbi:MAG: DUF1848 family protein [Chitinivibrionales bacterium]|nr:DUF1848 family protein [Chitinivibrionales bacterium]
MAFTGWQRLPLILDSGEEVEAIAPVIVSASRSTDIPAFYGEWFVERFSRGYVTWINPFSGRPMHVSFAKTRAAVFWTKNPRPMLRRLPDLDTLLPNYYFLFTLNDYEREGWEPQVPALDERIDTFHALSRRLGPGRVVWRADPLVLSDTLHVAELSARLERIASALEGATHKLVVSFVDIERYPKVKRNLARANARCRRPSGPQVHELAATLADIGAGHGMTVATCAEELDLREYGIEHNRCIDDALLRREFGGDRELMAFLGEGVRDDRMDSALMKRHPLRDKGQRSRCGCIVSKDIGRYDTCPHLCVYCYANSSPQAVARNRSEMKSGFPAVLGASPGGCSGCGQCM